MSEVEFELRKLGDLIEIYNNKRVPLSAKQREGLEKIYPYYGAQGIVDYVDDYIFDGKYILIAEDGENLKSNNKSICTLATGKYWVNNHAHIIEGNDETNTDFLYYKLNSISFAPYITGSAQPKLNKENLLNIELYIPSREHQDKIAKVLTLLDQKIQTNNQINQELEAMAKTLYDYWFVQFDFPDQNGNPYKSSGGKMVYSPELKREIPEGWGVEKLGDVAYLKAGGDKPSNISEIQSKETPFPIYSNGLDNKGLYGYTNKATIHKKSLTVSARGTIGYIQRRFSSFFPIIRLISVTPKEEKMIGYIENFLKSIQFENSGSVQRQLTVPQIDKLYILVPKNEVLKKYHSMTINYYFEVENNEQQNQELIQLRDWLLPMLMNGQVKVE
ncbi:restriction endonuclease subunit S [Streptococcus mitis]|uniref:restriction endonuclease subunit S n=1 Tax=Streptococcus mitis TaxID=28037 RepID=UPI0039C11E80